MTTLATPTAALSEQHVLDALAAAGFHVQDGWFYPMGNPDRAAVRFSVFGGQYQIWRRRKLQSPWMLIAARNVQEFDQESFDTWRGSWPLTH